MIRWPSLKEAGPSEAAEPIELSLYEASRPLGPFAQVAIARRSAEDRDAPEPVVIPDAAASGAPARTARHLLALAASLAAHVALAAVLGFAVMHEGVEAEMEAISVQIVPEPMPDEAEAPSVAGEGGAAAEAGEPAETPQTVEASAVVSSKPDQPTDEAETVTAEAQPVAAEAAEPSSEETTPIEDRVAPVTAEEAATVSPPGAVATAILPQFEPLDPPSDVAFAAVPADPTASPEPAVAAERTEEMTEPLDQPSPAPPVLAAAPSLRDMLPRIAVPPPPRLPEIVPEQPKASVAAPPQVVTKAEPERPAKPRSSKPERNSRKAAKAKSAEPVARKTETVRKPARADKSTTAPEKRTAKKTAQAPGAQAGAAASAKASAGAMESYGRTVNRHVQRYKRYPAEAARAGMKGAVRLSISIGGSGNLAAARVTGSSGHAQLDSEALATVRRAAPYPRPPQGGRAQFSLTLRYSR